jgi:hypothetical protein
MIVKMGIFSNIEKIISISNFSVTVGAETSISSSTTRVLSVNFTEENSLHKNPSYYPRNCNFEEPIITEIALNHGLRRVHSGGSITGAFSRAFNDELPHAKDKVISFFSGLKNDQDAITFDQILKSGKYSNEFVIGGHGSRDGTEVINRSRVFRNPLTGKNSFERYDGYALAIAIENHPSWVQGTPVRLIICNAGKVNGLAQELSSILGSKVTAATDVIRASRMGESVDVKILNGGKWVTYGN